jgi:serine/threonine protein phosphatase PrpC
MSSTDEGKCSAESGSAASGSGTPRRKRISIKWRAVGDTDIGGSRENQDDMFIWEKPELGLCVIGVLDGHGRDVGQTASATGRTFFLNYFERNYERLISDPYHCLVDGISEAHEAVRESFMQVLQQKGWEIQNTGEDYLIKRRNANTAWACVHGGTSCSIIALVGSTLYAANVGDSSGILSASLPVLHPSMVSHLGDSAMNHKRHTRPPSGGASQEERSDTLVLTAEHSPESPEEFLRMREFKCRDGDPSQPSLLVVYDASTHDKSRCSPVFSLDSAGNPVVTNRGRSVLPSLPSPLLSSALPLQLL